ncbi:MAG TPA: DUF4097 family beta strand repeat-containing protein [Actinoplanes sp.]
MTKTAARRAGVLALIAATTATLTGCAGVVGARMTYQDTEKTKITEIRITGGSGDVLVTTGAATETTIKRIVRRSTNPGESYRLDGTKLLLDTSCGNNCQVSYEIQAPAGVAVGGELRSGDVQLTGVGTTDLKVTSGDVTVRDATGPVQLRATSGDIRVLDAKSTVKVQSTSGDIQALNAGGAVDLKVTSGDITANLAVPASVTARTTSGDVNVTVPAGAYQVTEESSSGDSTMNGITSDPKAKNVIRVETRNGDTNISAAA